MTPAAVVILMLVGAASTGSSDSAPAIADPPNWDRYDEVVDLNIFVRQRGRRPEPRERPRDDAPVAMPAPRLVLRGVSRRGDMWIAFVEDIRSEQMLKVTSGDELNGGRVESVSITGINYSYGKATVDVAVGGMIGAGRRGSGTAASSEAPADSPASSAASATPDAAGKADKTMSILERLRRKREAQLGKSASP